MKYLLSVLLTLFLYQENFQVSGAEDFLQWVGNILNSVKYVRSEDTRRQMRELTDCGKRYVGLNNRREIYLSHCLRDCEWVTNPRFEGGKKNVLNFTDADFDSDIEDEIIPSSLFEYFKAAGLRFPPYNTGDVLVQVILSSPKIPENLICIRDCVFGETDIPSRLCRSTSTASNYYQLGKFIWLLFLFYRLRLKQGQNVQ